MASVEFTKVNLPKDDSYIKNVFVPILSESSVLGFTYDFLDDFERIKKGKTRKRCIFEFCGITLGLLLGYLLVYLLINWHPIAAFVGIIFSFQLIAWTISYAYCFLKVLSFTLMINGKHDVNSPFMITPEFLDNSSSFTRPIKGETERLDKEEKLDFYFNLYKDGGLEREEYENIKAELLSN